MKTLLLVVAATLSGFGIFCYGSMVLADLPSQHSIESNEVADLPSQHSVEYTYLADLPSQHNESLDIL